HVEPRDLQKLQRCVTRRVLSWIRGHADTPAAFLYGARGIWPVGELQRVAGDLIVIDKKRRPGHAGEQDKDHQSTKEGLGCASRAPQHSESAKSDYRRQKP